MLFRVSGSSCFGFYFTVSTLQRPLQNPLSSNKSFILPSNWDRESFICSQPGKCKLGLEAPAAARSLSCPQPAPPGALTPTGPSLCSCPLPPKCALPAHRRGLFWVNPKSRTAASSGLSLTSRDRRRNSHSLAISALYPKLSPFPPPARSPQLILPSLFPAGPSPGRIHVISSCTPIPAASW